jgi:glycine/D-amino acid oxidase-like deaminating enzyme
MPRVAVVGAGIVGVSCAWELTQRGVEVVLYDRGDVSGATTGLGEGNVLCGDKDAGPELALAQLGLAVFDELEALLGDVAKIRRKGALIVHPDAQTWADEPARVARLVAAGVDARLLDAEEVRDCEPQLSGRVCGATLVPGDLQCDPRAITRALAQRACAAGCELRTGVEIASLRDLDADAVVLAAGPWSAALANDAGLPLPLEPRKGQLARLRLTPADERFLRHKIVDGGYLLGVASGTAARQLSTVVETTHDGALVVGSSRERCGFDNSVDLALAEQLQARAARLVPAVAACEIADVWVGFRPWLPDHLPAVGASRRVDGLFVATGHEGAGVALGPISGRIIAQLICGETPALDVTPFDPDRFARPRLRDGTATSSRQY